MPAVDSLLLLGVQDEKLCAFLKKMGYALVYQEQERPLAEFLDKTNVDCVLLDLSTQIEGVNLCEYLRSEDRTRKVPIICLGGSTDQVSALQQAGHERLEMVEAPFSIGKLVSRIATQLRLRKMAGAEVEGASLGEMLAAQRDISEHIRKEIDEARKIQRDLLPKELPSDTRYELAVNYQPLEDVGGDWFYAQKEYEDKLTIQIADVTGHGLSAAFIGSMTKLAFSAVAIEAPHERLTQINKLMTPQLPEGRFVTVNSVLYDPTSGKLQLARGGHPPVLVLSRRNGLVSSLQPNGFAIGFFEDTEYEHAEAILDPGDVAIVFTDGITEAQNRKFECYGLARLSHVLTESLVTAGAEDVLCAILDDFQKFLDGRVLKDDVTLIVLRRVK